MQHIFLHDSIQKDYLNYLDKSTKLSSNSYLPYFVKLHQDFDWYFDLLQKQQKTLSSLDMGDIKEKEVYELPFLLFIYVSNADNIIEYDEYSSFVLTIKKFQTMDVYKNFINKAINIDKFHYSHVQNINSSESELQNKLKYINVLIQKYSPTIRVQLLYLIVIIIRYLATASRDFLQIDKINEYELRVIKDISQIFNLDILDQDSFKTIGSSSQNDICLQSSKGVENKHLYIKTNKKNIIVKVAEKNFVTKINNTILEKNVPYIVEAQDILFLGEYTITYHELLFFITYHMVEHVYSIENHKLDTSYHYKFNKENIQIINDSNLIEKFDYFDIVNVEKYIIYYDNIIEEFNNNIIPFNDNQSLHISLAKKNTLMNNNDSNADITITKENKRFRIQSSFRLFYEGREITEKDSFIENDKFYYNSIRCTLTNDGLYFKHLVSYDISLKSLTVKYQDNIILNNFNIDINSSDMICIMGPSGCGKTTLLDTISYPDSIKKSVKSGLITYNGRNLYDYYDTVGQDIGFVSQDDVLLANLTVYENLKYYMMINGLAFDKHLIETTLDDIGLLSKKDLRVGDKKDRVLSGGQRKRLNIALEFVKSPKILFLDEPTSGLSSKDSESIVKLLRKLSDKGVSTISVLHQPSHFIFDKFDKFLFLMEGYIAYYGDINEAYDYFSTFEEHQSSSCNSPDLFFDIAEAIELDENGFEVKLLKDGHLYERKHKYSGEYLNQKFMNYKKDIYHA